MVGHAANWRPSSFKVFVHESCAYSFPLPPAVDWICNYSSGCHAWLKDMRGGTWPVLMQREGTYFLITITDGWSHFMHAANVRVNETTIFKENTTNVFIIKIYDPNGCERGVVWAPACASQETDESNSSFCCFLLQEHLRKGNFIGHPSISMLPKLVRYHLWDERTLCTWRSTKKTSPNKTIWTSRSSTPQTFRFVKRLKGYQLIHTYLELSKRFVEDTGMAWPQSVMLHNGHGQRWRTWVKLRCNNRSVRFFITGGWTAFARWNKLRDEGIVLFTIEQDGRNAIIISKIEEEEGSQMIHEAHRGGYLI
ncbi:hypothetical protein C2S51_036869 [Perilla frutescens var. frutescens]|nr:hypothetical protein C2S51_036869 [Perilla frutescens var. frutescens]